MKVVKTIREVKKIISEQTKQDLNLGLIPTMGALHNGHLSLIERAKKNCDLIWVSIFVNPTQFNDKNDFELYPRDYLGDISKIKAISDDINIFIPHTSTIYNEKVESEKFDFGLLNKIMEAKFRAGHFNGVATIVKKLFKIFNPNFVYFGEKDFQQTTIIKKIIMDYFPKINLIVCPTLRQNNGLALSSRNKLIGEKSLNNCGIIFESLIFTKKNYLKISFSDLFEIVKEKIQKFKNFELEYFEIRDEETMNSYEKHKKKSRFRAFICVRVDGIRLIDNLLLN